MTLTAILVALGLMPVFHEDKPVTPEKSKQLDSVAAAVLKATRTPDEAAFLIAWGDAETHFSLRIHAGLCAKHECDRGKARSPWQLHRVAAMSSEQWERMHGVEHVEEQALVAAARARWAMRQCPGDPIRGGFRVLGGLGCQKALRGERERVAAFNRARAKL